MSIAVDKNGTIFVADLETHRIWKVPSAGGEPVEFVTVPAPRGLAIDDSGRLWVVSHGKDQLLRISADGKLEPVVRDRPFRFPHNVVIDQQHVAYVSDGYAKTIWKVNDLGETQAWITGEPLVNPVGLAWSGENLIIVDPQARAVFEADKDGKLTTVLSAAD
jgi:sugar lactone lactonase YvrE